MTNGSPFPKVPLRPHLSEVYSEPLACAASKLHHRGWRGNRWGILRKELRQKRTGKANAEKVTRKTLRSVRSAK